MKEQMIEKILENQKIILDGSSWRFCEFRNCEIVVETGCFDLINCSIKNCRLTLGGNAANVVSIIELFYPGRLPYSGEPPKPRKE